MMPNNDAYTYSYHKPSAQCNQCYKSIFSDKQQVQKQRQNKLSKLNDIFKLLFKPSCIRICSKKKIVLQEHCSCTTVSNVTASKFSESMTYIDLPWIVPSKYHNTNGPEDQWIFRTGWTPQPDASALLNNGWCSHCGSGVKSEECPSCDWDMKQEK